LAELYFKRSYIRFGYDLQKSGEWQTEQKERGMLKWSKKTKTHAITNCMMTKLRKEEKAPRFQTNSHDAMRNR